MVLCSQVEHCAMEAAMGDCEMAPGSECCEDDASSTPPPGSTAPGVGLAGLQAPIPAMVNPGPGLAAEGEYRPGSGTSAQTPGSAVAIYTLLTTLLI